MAERSFAMVRLDEIERALGKGPTFTPTERNLVLKHGVPPWLIVGQKVAKGAAADRCTKAIEAITKLYDDVQLALPEALRVRGDG